MAVVATFEQEFRELLPRGRGWYWRYMGRKPSGERIEGEWQGPHDSEHDARPDGTCTC